MCLASITQEGFETKGIGWKLVCDSGNSDDYFLALGFRTHNSYSLPRGRWLVAQHFDVATLKGTHPSLLYNSGFHVTLRNPQYFEGATTISTPVLYRKGRIVGLDFTPFGVPTPTIVADQIYFPLPGETLADLRRRLRSLTL